MLSRILTWCGIFLRIVALTSALNWRRGSFSSSPQIAYLNQNRHYAASPLIILGSFDTVQAPVNNKRIFLPDERTSTTRDGTFRDTWDGTPYSDGNCSPPHGTIEFSGSCYQILSQGPCPDNFWIILDNSGQPECDLQKCRGQLLFNGICVDPAAKDVCPVNEILYVEYSGHVYCDCDKSSVYVEKLRQCLPEHSQGSCEYGQYIESNKNGEIECVDNPCIIDSQVFNQKDNRCYRKSYSGKCIDDGTQIISFEDNTALCEAIGTRNILEVQTRSSCPVGSKLDHLDRCQRTFQLGRFNPFSFRVPTKFTIPVEADGCPPNYVTHSDNSCQKPHSLFG